MVRIAYVAVVILLAMNVGGGSGGPIGINWGLRTSNRLIPSTVVDLLLQNEITNARIYTADEDIMEAFCGSGINFTISILDTSVINSTGGAEQWVQQKSWYFEHANIRRVYMGNHVFVQAMFNKTLLEPALSAFVVMQHALATAGFGFVKLTMPQPTPVLTIDNFTQPSNIVFTSDNFTKPSHADFHAEIKEQMQRYLQMLQANNAPFIVELFPIYYITSHNLDPSFAINDGKSKVVIEDVNGAVYDNVFDFLFDSFVWAIRKAGVPDLEIVVGAVGWPTDGWEGGNTSSAEHFFKYLLPHVSSNKGTPLRPGKPIETFIHSLTDENLNPYGGDYARHWGIYRSNGEPKFKIDLTGRGRDVFPTKAKGIQRMPERWCVYKDDESNNQTEVVDQLDAACLTGDCTTLAPGASCSGLSFAQNVSYAFNMYFQVKFQDEVNGCNFGGYGVVVTENPSTPTCVFPVEVVRGQQVDVPSSGQRLVINHRRPGFASAAIFVHLFSMFCVLNY